VPAAHFFGDHIPGRHADHIALGHQGLEHHKVVALDAQWQFAATEAFELFGHFLWQLGAG